MYLFWSRQELVVEQTIGRFKLRELHADSVLSFLGDLRNIGDVIIIKDFAYLIRMQIT